MGIKGVAMTGFAQILSDAHKNVTGTDTAEDFVTKEILDHLNIAVDNDFSQLPANTDCLIYTAAHQGIDNPQVQLALQKGIKIYSHAEALGELFNQKKGLAICGVGGKSTTSAMVAFVLEKTERDPSFAVGVGSIIGLPMTAKWDNETDYFVAEADEYVTDPNAVKKGMPITPRFSYMKPFATVCTNLKFDHPDVYRDFNHTKEVFNQFFAQINSDGFLIINHKDKDIITKTSASKILTVGQSKEADFSYQILPSDEPQTNLGQITFEGQNYTLKLKIAGDYNFENAVFAIAGLHALGLPITESTYALADFASTKRRFEYIGVKNGVTYYDDYAHHPSEIKSVITALNNWHKDKRKIFVFQPHTFSRTKQLLSEFATAFDEAEEVYLLDIFASAREAYDDSISSDLLLAEIQKNSPHLKIKNLKTIANLREFFASQNDPKLVCMTIGAGDIYQVYDIIRL